MFEKKTEPDKFTIFLTSGYRSEACDNQILSSKSESGVKCVWRCVKDSSLNTKTGQIEISYYYMWQFDWSSLKKEGIVGLVVQTKLSYDAEPTKTELTRCGQIIQKKVPPNYINSQFHDSTVDIEIIRTQKQSIVSNFALSDKTDVVLNVEGTLLHVNKALLSYHSDYFRALFSSEFKEKSMEVVPIDDVKLDDFAALLSLIQENPIFPTENNAEKLLELSDRFLMTAAKRHVEDFLIGSKIDITAKVVLADKYGLKTLLDLSICSLTRVNIVRMAADGSYDGLSYETKSELFHRLASIL